MTLSARPGRLPRLQDSPPSVSSSQWYSSWVLEKDIQRQCLDYLAYKGYYHWRQNAGVIPTGNGFRRFVGKKGLPDIWIILPPHGTLVACEVKQPGKNLSPDQKTFHKDLVDLGGISMVVHSIEELEKDLEGLL